MNPPPPPANLDDLSRRWRALTREFGLSAAQAEPLLDDLSAHYRGRPYHNLAHILSLLHLADRFAAQARDFTALRLAIWYHDLIYDPTASDNESRSAAYMRAVLENLVPPQTLARAAAWIEATTHRAPADDPDACLLQDLDLSILAASPDSYRRYQQAIRQEYAYVPDAVYRLGRRQALQNFLARERIFLTEALAPLETAARQNLQAELDELFP